MADKYHIVLPLLGGTRPVRWQARNNYRSNMYNASHSLWISFVDQATVKICVRIGPPAICNATPMGSSRKILTSKEWEKKNKINSITFCSPLYNLHRENAAYPLGWEACFAAQTSVRGSQVHKKNIARLFTHLHTLTFTQVFQSKPETVLRQCDKNHNLLPLHLSTPLWSLPYRSHNMFMDLCIWIFFSYQSS